MLENAAKPKLQALAVGLAFLFNISILVENDLSNVLSTSEYLASFHVVLRAVKLIKGEAVFGCQGSKSDC